MMNFKKTLLENKKTYKKILLLMLPIILSTILQNIVGIIDNFMVSKIPDVLQTDSLRAVGISTEVISFTTAFIWGVEAIAMIFLNQFYGAKKFNHFKETIKIAVVLNLIIAFIAFVVSSFFTKEIILIFISENETKVIEYAQSYLRIIMISFIFLAMSQSMLGGLIVIGKSKYYFFIGSIALFSNVLFNTLFIYVFKKGVTGVAYSTLISRMIEFSFIFFLFLKNRQKLLFNLKPKLNIAILKAMGKKFFIGTSAFVAFFAFVAYSAIYMKHFKKEVTTPLGMAYSIIAILFSIVPGILSSTKVFVGKKLGSNEFKKAERNAKFIIHVAVFLSIIFALFVTLMIVIFAPLLMENNESVWYLQFMVISYAIIIVIIATTTAFIAVLNLGGYSILPSILNDYLQTFLALPIIILLTSYSEVQFEIIFLLPMIINLTSFFITFYLYKQKKWLKNIVDDIN